MLIVGFHDSIADPVAEVARLVDATVVEPLGEVGPILIGHERRLAITSVSDGVIGFVIMLALVPFLGLYGAPLGSLLSMCLVSLPANLRALAREEGGSAARFLQPLAPWLKRCLVAVGLVVVILSLGTVRSVWLSVLIGGAVGMAYIALMLPVMAMLTAVVGVVLLIACANLAGLLLARAAGRQREVAVRLAVGASRGRLIRQFLVETALLAIGGGAAGLLLSFWTADLLNGFLPSAPVPIGFPFAAEPPQTMNSLPDQTTVAPSRGVGALVLVTGLHTPVTVL